MKSLKVNFVPRLYVIILLLITSCGILHHSKVSYPLLSIRYSEENSTHSRSICANNNILAIAASDGRVYLYSNEKKEIIKKIQQSSKENRDIILANNKILILAVGDTSITWNYHIDSNDSSKTIFDAVFLDGFDNFGNTVFMMGDPVHGNFSLFKSTNLGESWESLKNSPLAYQGEAGFAASGTNVKVLDQNTFAFVSGGEFSRYFQSNDSGVTWFSSSIGYKSGPTCGAYSFVILQNGSIVSVGGDYLKPDESSNTCRISTDGGKTWYSSKSNPNGYRSNVSEINGILYCCGTNGIDYSKNDGKTWQRFAYGNYFTLCLFDNKLAASSINGTIQLFNLK